MNAEPTPPPATDEASAIVRIERLLPALPAEVYAAWTEPSLLGQWMSPVGHAEVDLDLRIGGPLRVAMVGAGVRIEHRGEFLELDPPNRLRFSWISEFTAGASLVTVELSAAGTQTRLVLTHERLPGHAVTSHSGGWAAMLERLASLVAVHSAQEGAS